MLQGRGAQEPLRIWPPVVLAPMAGVTNIPFRALCRRFGAGLYVSEMITARGLIEGNAKTLHLAGFAPAGGAHGCHLERFAESRRPIGLAQALERHHGLVHGHVGGGRDR